VDRILKIQNLSKSFGGVKAIEKLDFIVDEGELLGLIGPNGAGKTTLFNLISGFYRPTSGQIFFKGEDLTCLRPDLVSAKGIVRTFQHSILFSNVSALQNVLVGSHLQAKLYFWPALFNTIANREREKKTMDRALDLLSFVGLDHVKNELACNLPHGYQRCLGVAIALAANPRVLLLDEPMTGMNQEETKMMMELVKKINQSGTTVLIVEHNMKAVMGICSRVVVINFGSKIAEGSPQEISKNAAVIQAYLGA
jgi:branched-chain amino acid transport system ATP-binding protein